ncbi:unnamed protein product [Fraxinus pennsylvanica]|uniref:Uncharacterized protein n=1 Tax=Fraxinus pennsylvanica TaxID=56036 RepID=A0AAD2A6B8_9LAMI|nr:unnamed protein product [Fraxinus pennsylvanica]
MAIVEVFLGAILTVLLEKLASVELLKFLRPVGIDAQLEEWHTTLSMIQAVLTDAENKQTANVAVKQWLNDLEDLAYDLEDLVDELNTEALQRKLKENKGSTSKVRKLIPTCCTNLSYNDFMFNRGIASKLKDISGRLEALSKKIKMLSLVDNVRGRSYKRLQTTSLVVESEVYGREEDKEKILEIVFGVESNDSQISVIPIVGMGGVGKTTLVQLVYNDERLKFDLKAWACVSDEFNAVRVTKNILEAVSSERCDYDNFDKLQNLESLTQIKLNKIFGLTSIIKAFVQFPFTLQSLSVGECDDLVTLWPNDNTVRNLVNLREVLVESCPKVVSLQEIDVLPHLRGLAISRCGALELLPNKISCLEELSIIECPSLKVMMKLQDCSTTLRNLFIMDSWVNLNLTNLLGSGHIYQSLTRLWIEFCDGLESFPHGGLPTPNLGDLRIKDCKHLKSLPDRMDLLSSLEVSNCASLMELFPQENIPPNLSDLTIENCGKLKPLGEWGLHKLISLTYFRFGGCPELVSFTNNADEEHCVLPPSLTQLSLSHLPNLETLSKGLQSLTSLQHLSIYFCPKLKALPMKDHLKKLLSLDISGCTRLEKRCLKKKGDYWPIIADIPDVQIDDRSIYDPSP